MNRFNSLDITALVLLIIGGLNWLLVGAFRFDLVWAIFGGLPILARIVYIIVGLAALFAIVRLSEGLAHKHRMHPTA